MTNDPIVICSYARTPMGGFQGALGSVSATALGATAVKAAVERAGVSPDAVGQIFMGCVLPAGLGQMGVTREMFDTVIKGALVDHCHKTNPREASAEEYRQLLVESF